MRSRILISGVVFPFLTFLLLVFLPSSAWADACSAPPNAIVAENCQPGNPAIEWDIAGAGDPSIQGFATDISVNRGQTISFKVKTDAASYHIDIYASATTAVAARERLQRLRLCLLRSSLRVSPTLPSA